MFKTQPNATLCMAAMFCCSKCIRLEKKFSLGRFAFTNQVDKIPETRLRMQVYTFTTELLTFLFTLWHHQRGEQ